MRDLESTCADIETRVRCTLDAQGIDPHGHDPLRDTLSRSVCAKEDVLWAATVRRGVEQSLYAAQKDAWSR